MKLYFIILSFVTIVTFQSLIAQNKELKFNHITIKEGLSNNEVYSIVQDNKGFLWFATEDGLDRYNGYEIKSYKSVKDDPFSLPDNSVIYLFTDKKGNLWVFTKNGISLFNPLKDNFEKIGFLDSIAKTHKTEFTASFSEDIDGKVIIANLAGQIFKYEHDKKKFNQIYLHKEECTHILCLVTDKNGNIWFGTHKGLYLLNSDYKTVTKKNVLFKELKKDSFDYITHLCYSDDKLWVCSKYQNVFCFDPITEKSEYFKFPERKNAMIYFFNKDIENNFWIGDADGLRLYDKNTKKLISCLSKTDDKTTLASPGARCLYTDKQGNTWVGSALGGINVSYKRKGFENLNTESGGNTSLSRNIVSSLFEDKDGDLWVGSFNDGLDIINLSKKTKIHLEPDSKSGNSIKSGTVLSVIQDHNGYFWLSTYLGGLQRYNKQTGEFKSWPGNPKNLNTPRGKSISAIAEDNHGKLWLACYEYGIDIFDPVKNVFNYYSHDPANPKSIPWGPGTRFLFENDKIWYGTYEGLALLDSSLELLQIYKFKKDDTLSLSGNTINCLYKDKGNNLWVGTSNGLNLYNRKDNNFYRITVSKGLPNSDICGVLDDNHGNIWVSTKRGLVKLTFEKSNSGKPLIKKIKIFLYHDGIQANQFYMNAFCKSSKTGKFFFGGINGVTSFYPDSIKDNPFIPPVYLTDFKLFYKSVTIDGKQSVLYNHISETKEITLNYNQNVFTLEFVALNFIASAMNKYAYKMEGFDRDWIYVGNKREATFTNLNPGSYVFKVKASNNDGYWNEQGISLKINILPPFWKTLLFKVIFIMFVLLLIFIFIRLRVRDLMRQKKILEHKVAIRTKDLIEKNNELQKQKEEITAQRDEIEAQNEEIISQKDEIETQMDEIEKQRDIAIQRQIEILDSIQYAKNIQSAVLPNRDLFSKLLPGYFIYFKPRDIVSGDFYWISQVNGKVVVAAADCTGHGVPGAFMSMLGISALNEIVNTNKLTRPDDILNQLRNFVIKSLHQTETSNDANDGMDIALCTYDFKNLKLQYAGANNPLILIRGNQLFEFSSDKMPVGILYNSDIPFAINEIDLQHGDCFYIYSDGFPSQIGEKSSRKFLTKNFKQLLLDIHQFPIKVQENMLDQAFTEWMGSYRQIDDILIIGIKV